MAQKLATGLKATVLVIAVEENFDSYTNTDQIKMNCHKVYFDLDDETYPAQQCTSLSHTNFKTGDQIDIVIKSFTKGIYTINVDRVIPFSDRQVEKKSPIHAAIIEDQFKSAPGTWGRIGQDVTGTPRQFALDAAVRHYQNRIGITGDNVLELAAKFEEYLREKTD